MLVLLDIDGVMVKAVSWKAPELLQDGFADFAESAVAALKAILLETGAGIVLTSSHKHHFSLEAWQAMFATRGIVAAIDRLDDNINHLSRKDEITIWIAKNTPRNFVIIDDDTGLHDLPDQLKQHLVSTSSMIGLTEAHAAQAIAVLKSETIRK